MKKVDYYNPCAGNLYCRSEGTLEKQSGRTESAFLIITWKNVFTDVAESTNGSFVYFISIFFFLRFNTRVLSLQYYAVQLRPSRRALVGNDGNAVFAAYEYFWCVYTGFSRAPHTHTHTHSNTVLPVTTVIIICAFLLYCFDPKNRKQNARRRKNT